jgi:hypothetical protein
MTPHKATIAGALGLTGANDLGKNFANETHGPIYMALSVSPFLLLLNCPLTDKQQFIDYLHVCNFFFFC